MDIHTLSVYSDKIKNAIQSEITVTNTFTGDVVFSHGIWDTGATNSVITKSLAETLNLIPVTRAVVTGVHGSNEVNVYYVKLTLNNKNVSVNIRVTEGAELSADSSVGMLIGMDIINLGDFAITNFNGKTVMSFRIPSMQKIDFVEGIKHSQPIVKDKLPSRNDPCPCGSGKKYKHCCGENK